MSILQFLGAAGTVTGSQYLLTADSQRIVVDVGMFQGPPNIEALNAEPLSYDPKSIDAVIITHAHLDHCGLLPLLTKGGYRGPIYMTDATKALLWITLSDAAHIMHDTDEFNALYTIEDVEHVLSNTVTVSYDKLFHVADVSVYLRDAGHILGSASVEILTKAKQTIVFSGDIGNYPEDLVRPTHMFDHADIVVMESTYGDHVHSTEDPADILFEEIQAVEQSGGTLLIPAFSVERTQELLHILDHLKKEKVVRDETSVFLDSPMAIRATDVYRKFRNLYSRELYKHQLKDDPFDFPGLQLIESYRDSIAIHTKAGPRVIIAGSGMMTGGRILSHAASFLDDPNNRILFVGFQGEGTLGRMILDGAKSIKIHDRMIPVMAHVRKSSGMSAHADQPRLLSWLRHMQGVREVYLTHGEDTPRAVLQKKIQPRHSGVRIYTPKRHDTVTLE